MTEAKRPELTDERFANWCMDTFEDQKDKYLAFSVEQSRWIDILEARLLTIKQSIEEHSFEILVKDTEEHKRLKDSGEPFFTYPLKKIKVVNVEVLGVLLEPKAQPKKGPQFVNCELCGRQFWSATAKQCPSCRNAKAYAKRLEPKSEANNE